MTSSTINNWAVRSRQLIQPASQQSTAYLNGVLYDIGDGFRLINGVTVVTSGASTTLTSTSSRRVLIAGNNLTHQVNLPATPSAGDPLVEISNAGTGNVITISGNGKPIMSGSTAGEITLRSPGDHITLIYVNGTIGWAILSIKSRRLVSPSGSGTIQLHRFQDNFVNIVDSATWAIVLAPPTDAQSGDTVSIALQYVSGNSSTVTITPASGTIQGSASFILSDYWTVNANQVTQLYKSGTNWLVSRYL